MSGENLHSVQWEEVVASLQPELFQHHLAIRKQYKDGLLKGQMVAKFPLERIWDGRGRLDWIKLIKQNPQIKDCLSVAKDRLNEKYDAKWLTKYHSLYYGIKNEGFKTKGSPMTAIRFGDDFYYRMDGTHRSSVLFDLGIKNIPALVIDFKDVCKINPELKAIYEGWVLSNYRNYQKMGSTGQSRIEDRYINLVEMTRDYFSDKVVGDVGCNSGYLSILLSNQGASEVRGYDINELDIEAAEIFAERWSENHESISFHRGHVTKNLASLLSCDVIFFVRSIYHLGKDADLLIKALKPGTKVIVECNVGHKKKLPDPDEVKPIHGKRLALKINLIPFLEERGFRIDDTLKNVDDVVIATRL